MDRQWSRQSVTLTFMGAAFIVALGLAGVVLAVNGAGTEGIRRALRLTARFSYLLFWCAYAGGGLAVLFGPSFRRLAQHGRDFGLAFASAHSIHVLLVLWLYRISVDPPISDQAALIFIIGIVWMYLLALLSIDPLSKALGARVWRPLRFVGLEYIQFAFLLDFLPGLLGPPDLKNLIAYVPFAILGLAGTGLRAVTWMQRRVPNLVSGAKLTLP